MGEVDETDKMGFEMIDPSAATSAEEFDVAIKARHNELRLGMLADEKMYESALEYADSHSADEIEDQIAALGDESKLTDAYQAATLRDRAEDPRGDSLSCAKFQWEDAVARRAYLDMALNAATE